MKMTHDEMIQAIAGMHRDVNQAATLLSHVTTKLAAVSSQLMENLRTAAPAVQPVVTPEASTPVPPVDFGGSQAGPTLETPAPTALPVPASTGPTVETPAGDPVMSEVDRKQEQLGHFAGTGSLVARFLSPQVVIGGKGFLKPGVAGLEQYRDDITRMAPQRMYEWPTGFYRDKDTSVMQFMINTTKAVLIYTQLPGYGEPQVVLKSPLAEDQQAQSVEALPMIDMLLLKEALEKELRRLSDLVTPPTA